jgi:mono/diheme cytochrome c family protein
VIAFALFLALAQDSRPVSPAPQGEAKELFAKNKCITCHGEDGRGDTVKGRKLHTPDFTDPKFQKETTDDEMVEGIVKGVKDTKGKILMPSYKGKLTDADIQTLARYVRAFGRGG